MKTSNLFFKIDSCWKKYAICNNLNVNKLDKIKLNKFLLGLMMVISITLLFILSVSMVHAFTGESGSYTINSKTDSFAETNATSSSFTQRLIGGIQSVGEYVLGRFGILNVDLAVNITSHTNFQEIPRGADTDFEDDLGIVPDFVNITAQVFENGTEESYRGAICYFYNESVLMGSTTTNSSGHCTIKYTKSTLDVGSANLSINFSASTEGVVVPRNDVNISIAVYNISRAPGNKGVAASYADGQTAIFYFNITKTNSSGTFAYHPKSINVTAMGSGASAYYDDSAYVADKRVYNVSTGKFESHVVVDRSFDTSIRWQVRISDDGYDNFLASTSHADVAITDGAVCGNTFIESPETCDDGNLASGDGCSNVCATEVITPPGGGGGDGDCTFEAWGDWTDWTEWSDFTECINGYQNRTRSHSRNDNCGDTQIEIDTEVQLCGECVPDWQCVAWSDCMTLGGSGTTGSVITGSAVSGITGDVTKDIPLGGTEIFDVNGGETTEPPATPPGEEDDDDDDDTTIIILPPGATPTYDPFQFCLEWQDNKNCDPSFGKPTEEYKECLLGLVIEYTPQNLFPVVANNTKINFGIYAEYLGGFIENKWYLNSLLQATDSGYSPLTSGYSHIFKKSADVKAGVSVSGKGEDILWDITVDPTLDPDCVENWTCQWTSCENAKYKYASNCEDLEECGSTLYKPVKELCKCNPKFECGNWSACSVEYNIDDILHGEPTLTATRSRICNDITECEDGKIEAGNCTLDVPVEIRTTKWCFEDYVEIYESETGKIVSRIRQNTVGFANKLDIGIIVTDFGGYCDYCYDGVKNYDEEDIDCGGSGCAPCQDKGIYFDWLKYLIWFLWILLMFVLFYLIYKNKEWVKDMVKDIRRIRLRTPEEVVEKIETEPGRINRFFAGLRTLKFGIKIKRVAPVHYISPAKGKSIFAGLRKIFVIPQIKFTIPRVSVPRERVLRERVYETPRFKIVKIRKPDRFAYLKKMLNRWKKVPYIETAPLEKKLVTLEGKTTKSFRERGAEIKERFREWRKRRAGRKAERKIFRQNRKAVRKQARVLKKRIRRKEISKNEFGDLRKRLNEWKSKGYYDTNRLQKKLDKLEGRR